MNTDRNPADNLTRLQIKRLEKIEKFYKLVPGTKKIDESRELTRLVKKAVNLVLQKLQILIKSVHNKNLIKSQISKESINSYPNSTKDGKRTQESEEVEDREDFRQNFQHSGGQPSKSLKRSRKEARSQTVGEFETGFAAERVLKFLKSLPPS